MKEEENIKSKQKFQIDRFSSRPGGFFASEMHRFFFGILFLLHSNDSKSFMPHPTSLFPFFLVFFSVNKNIWIFFTFFFFCNFIYFYFIFFLNTIHKFYILNFSFFVIVFYISILHLFPAAAFFTPFIPMEPFQKRVGNRSVGAL